MDFKQKAAEVFDKVVAFRRDLHMYPEASMEEFRTTDKIAEAMDELGIAYRRLNPTGLVAEIKCGKPGKTVALRADIDALSVTEKTDLEFKSKNEGMMHACGHDTHAAMLVGAATILNGIKDELCGNIRLIFQPAEELATGAKLVIEQGGLEGVDMIFGQHIGGGSPTGIVSYVPGGAASAADMFRITVTGRSGHGAMPETAVDATVAAAAIVMNLQTMVSRELPASQPVVVTVGSLKSGSRFNVVSGEAVMEGTCRSYDVDVHHSLPGIMERIAKQTAAAFRCEAELEYQMMTEVLVNDPEALEFVKAAADKVVDDPAKVVVSKPLMGAEDFADYTVKAKAAFWFTGGGSKEPNHNDHIVFDENSFKTGVAMYAQVAYDFLNA